MIYILFLFILVILLNFEVYFKGWKKKIFRFFIPFLFLMLIGLRGDHVGVDTQNYIEDYFVWGQWGCPWIEPGFDFIIRKCYQYNLGVHFYIFILAFISILFTCMAINRLRGKYYSVTVFCIFIFNMVPYVNILRQIIAISIFMYAFVFIQKRKPFFYFLCISLAALFHASALILLPLYFLKTYRLENKIYIIIYILSFFFISFDLSRYLPQIELLNRNYAAYVTDVESTDFSLIGFVVTSLLNILVFVMIVINDLFKKHPLLCNFVFMYFVIYNLGMHLTYLHRISIYFQLFNCFLYPILFFECKRFIIDRNVTLLLLLSINFAIWFNTVFSTSNSLVPYSFFFE